MQSAGSPQQSRWGPSKPPSRSAVSAPSRQITRNIGMLIIPELQTGTTDCHNQAAKPRHKHVTGMYCHITHLSHRGDWNAVQHNFPRPEPSHQHSRNCNSSTNPVPHVWPVPIQRPAPSIAQHDEHATIHCIHSGKAGLCWL